MSFDPTAYPKVLTLYLKLIQYPILATKIRERMRRELFERGVISKEAFEAEVKEKAVQSQLREGLQESLGHEPDDLWTKRRAIIRDHLTDFYFAYNLPHELFEDIVRRALAGRLPSQDIVLGLHPELAPWDMLYAQGEAYEALPPTEQERVKHHLEEIKVVLIKTMISDHLEYIGLAKEWFTTADLKMVRARRYGRGKIGGKAAGLMLAELILRRTDDELLQKHVCVPRSWFIGADVFYQFTHFNELLGYVNQKYRSEEEIRSAYPEIVEAYTSGRFPEDVIDGLRGILDTVGPTPLIVRSSSLLEDSFGTSFAGKYESCFCPNQGSSKENLRQLVRAISRVYASVFSPEVLLYRRRMRLIDYDERMAILIQEVQGTPHGRYFMPTAAGVAFSRNQFRWSPRIDRQAGFVRLVWGLGTRAVERIDGDYPRLVALSHPTLRPENNPNEILAYSQKMVDLIDLEANAYRTLPADQVIDPNTPQLRLVAQYFHEGIFRDFVTRPSMHEAREAVLTFDGLLRRTVYPEVMRRLLVTLESAYRVPVDTEFTLEFRMETDGAQTPVVQLVQCRPLSRMEMEASTLPTDIPPERQFFVSKRLVPDGRITGLRYVVYVSPQAYHSLAKPSDKQGVGRLIGHINKALEAEEFILVGPGRWGSNDPDMGVPVTYGDIHNARALLELVVDQFSAAPSHGTHFFQDLVETRIYSLAINPDDAGAMFRAEWIENAENKLADLLPEQKAWAEVVRVVDIQDVGRGALLELVMDGDAGAAMAYLTPTPG